MQHLEVLLSLQLHMRRLHWLLRPGCIHLHVQVRMLLLLHAWILVWSCILRHLLLLLRLTLQVWLLDVLCSLLWLLLMCDSALLPIVCLQLLCLWCVWGPCWSRCM
jgi:hypothetical protein